MLIRLDSGMTATPSTTCSSCNALLGDEDRVCTQCGAVMNVWSVAPRAPLILPGNPALSEDDTSGGSSNIRRFSAALAAVMVVGGITFAVAREPAERETAVASASTPESEVADSASAMSSGVVASETELARARAARDSASADSARAARRPLSALPSMPAAPPSSSTIAAAPAPQVEVATPAVVIPLSTRATARLLPTPSALTRVETSKVTVPPVVPAVVAAPVAAPTAPASSPVLRMAPLVSSVLRAGENLRLRGSIRDRVTGRELSAHIRFSSSNPRLARVDSRTGVVRGFAPGRVKITADAGSAGRMAVDLSVVARGRPVVIAPATPRIIVPPAAPATAPARPVATSIITDRSATAPAAVALVTTKPAVSTSVPTRATAPATATPAPLRDIQRPDANDVRVAADRFVAEVKSGLRRTEELKQFFGDGAEHRAALLGAPMAVTETATGVRATFDMRLSKFDAAGRPLARVAPVTIDIVKRDGALNTSAVAIGALRKP